MMIAPLVVHPVAARALDMRLVLFERGRAHPARDVLAYLEMCGRHHELAQVFFFTSKATLRVNRPLPLTDVLDALKPLEKGRERRCQRSELAVLYQELKVRFHQGKRHKIQNAQTFTCLVGPKTQLAG